LAEAIEEMLLDAAAQDALGILEAHALPGVIEKLLAAGADAPTLIELAGDAIYAWRDVRADWEAALDELGAPRLTAAQAAHRLILPQAQGLATRFRQGALPAAALVAALEGLNERYGHHEFLHDFCILYSRFDAAELEAALQKLEALPAFDPAAPDAQAAAFQRY
jgi:hypothetical protein